MVQRVSTVAFEGIEARGVDVQVQVAPGLPAFNIVGLPDKAVSEAKERVWLIARPRGPQGSLGRRIASWYRLQAFLDLQVASFLYPRIWVDV